MADSIGSTTVTAAAVTLLAENTNRTFAVLDNRGPGWGFIRVLSITAGSTWEVTKDNGIAVPPGDQVVVYATHAIRAIAAPEAVFVYQESES